MPKEYQQLSAAQRKEIAALKQSKHRKEAGLFVMEGTRSVLDAAQAFTTVRLVATSAWLAEHGGELPKSLPEPLLAKREDMERMSAMVTPQGVLAVCRIPEYQQEESLIPGPDELWLALDRVQDPGNLGTIIRMADWFGIHTVLASADTVDCFNPKVIQSTMGAQARVRVIYVDDLASVLRNMPAELEIYGTFLGGEPLYEARLSRGGVIVMGNEGRGISDEVAAAVNRRLTIPPFPADAATVESLNVAMAASVTVAEFRRRAALAGRHL